MSSDRSNHRRALVIGGGFAGLFAVNELKADFDVTLVDAKEYFEYTPGILRAYANPNHYDALSFTYQRVLECSCGALKRVNFLWGEVRDLDGLHHVAYVKPMFTDEVEKVPFDYCVISAGCNFGVFSKWGESLWAPTILDKARIEGSWPHLDERFIEGRRRHIVEENGSLKKLNDDHASVLVVGGGFIGVEWATQLQQAFPNLQIHLIDHGDRCLRPLPERASAYCDEYMHKHGIKTKYGVMYNPEDPGYCEKIGMAKPPDCTFVCVGVKAANYFMPKETLSSYNPLEPDKKEKDIRKRGPGGGGWIRVNKHLQVLTTNEDGSESLFGDGHVFAVGDCNMCTELPPIPKISYPAEEQAAHATKNIKILDYLEHEGHRVGHCCGLVPAKQMMDTWWPWGAGMFATSLGSKDGCFVTGAKACPGKGHVILWGLPSAIQKDLIESTKVDEHRGGLFGKCAWYFVHHTPFVN
ncbi:hypothetical protein FOL47_006477 [Perkinsus chesapeaki]|uniref:FAD/NAD(P)-binding domain-containing protein n=1 Tax=Perkinsus chesapeaki TaxID=330153 RepID=A0A7J6LRT7_PERCH|nr:hypothetical protein FOL47_006477 [Perkinsus chesapeaki]